MSTKKNILDGYSPELIDTDDDEEKLTRLLFK